MTLAQMQIKLFGKAIVLFNEFNGKTSHWPIKKVSHAAGGFLLTAEDNEGTQMSLQADVPTILNMAGQGITNELPCIKGGFFKTTISIR